MFRAASVLIVIAIIASPTAKLVCDVWCLTASPSSDAADSTCHDTHHEGGPAIQASSDACARVTAVGPFLTEVTYRALPTASAPCVVADASLSLLDLRHHDRAFLLRGDPGPPPGHTITILRI
jgi:hypothetical protein